MLLVELVVVELVVVVVGGVAFTVAPGAENRKAKTKQGTQRNQTKWTLPAPKFN